MPKLKKIFFVLFIMAVGIITISYNANAMRELIWTEFYLSGNCLMAVEVYDVTYCPPPLLCAGQYEYEVKQVFPFFPCNKEGMYGTFEYTNLNDSSLNFNIILDANVYLTANVDAVADVYELVSGKCAINNLSITKNQKIMLDDIEKDNKHYIIILKMSNGTYQQQIFFINNRQLCKGV